MVARRSDSNPAVSLWVQIFGELFEMWRQLVTWVLDRALATLARLSPAEQPRDAATHWLHRPGIVWLGDIALVIGATAGVALSEPGLARSVAAWAGFQSLLWAVVRWLLMTYAARDTGPGDSELLGASSLGLVVYGAAMTPELRAVAWVASAALTWFALALLGKDRGAAGRIVGIAWGAQALVVTASWIARGSVLAFLVSRG